MAQDFDPIEPTEQADPTDSTSVTERTSPIPRDNVDRRMVASGRRGGGFDIQKLSSTLVAVAALLVILVVGYMIVDTLLRIRENPVLNAPSDAATRVQEVLHPTPTIIADPQTIVLQVESLARLETASYTIEKVITAETNEGPFGFLFGDRLLLVAVGQVVAGVDMSRISEADIQVAGETVFITVPASEIFIATLDNDATYVYDRETGPFGLQEDLETAARQEAEDRILEAAVEDGILDLAQQNAERYIEGLLKALGFKEVVFVTATPHPDQDRGR